MDVLALLPDSEGLRKKWMEALQISGNISSIILILCFAGLTNQFPQGDLQTLDVAAEPSRNNTNATSTRACETARGLAGSCVDRQFCEYSTSAIDLTLYAPKGYKKLLWIVLSISAFVGAVYCGLSQFSRYSQEPVVVSLQRDYRRWQTTFPAMTACFLERINPEKAKEAIEKHWDITEESNPDRFQYYSEFLELVTDVSFRENLQNFWKYQDDLTVGGIDLLELALSVHPVAELSVSMSHTDKKVTWQTVITEMGMCLTLNSEYAEYQHMNDTEWIQEKLLNCHYLSGQCYVRIDSIDHAVRFFIHSPFEIATAISNPTGEIAPGEELIIDFKAVEIQAASSVRALTTEQRRCRYHDEWISPTVKAYSFALCQMHCRSRLAIMFCGCRPFFHVKGASLGGTTALFVGASVLTVVETALFIVRVVLEAVYRRVYRIQYKP